jgi:hypothetical protein
MIRHIEPHHLECIANPIVVLWVSNCIERQYTATWNYSHREDRLMAIEAARAYASLPSPEAARAAFDAYTQASKFAPGNPKAASSAAAHIILSSENRNSELALRAACSASRSAAEHVAAIAPVGGSGFMYMPGDADEFQRAYDEEEKWQLVDLSKLLGFELGITDREFLFSVLAGGWDDSIVDIAALVQNASVA